MGCCNNGWGGGSCLWIIVLIIILCCCCGGGWGGWGGSSAVADSATTAYIKENFNSLTAENEMKPCNVLGYQPTILTIEEAKNQGYIIPDSYTEA